MARPPVPPPPPPPVPVNGQRPKSKHAMPPPPPPPEAFRFERRPPPPPKLAPVPAWPPSSMSIESAMMELGYSPRAIAKANERTRHEIVKGKIAPVGVSILNNGNMYRVIR